MRAVCWWGKGDVRVLDVPDPEIINPHDAIVRITLTAICGSDLHLFDGVVPTMLRGDILGHEFMGEIVEVGSEVKKLKAGDRVVTTGGIYGQITKVTDQVVQLQIAPNVRIEIAKVAIGGMQGQDPVVDNPGNA